MPKVYNKNTDIDIPTSAIYIGRPSKYGNPFSISKDHSRNEVIKMYEDYILSHPDLDEIKTELKGKDLVCFCSPKKCHGDILIRLANDFEFVDY